MMATTDRYQNQYVFPVRFLTHFMLPLYVIMTLVFVGMGVGMLVGWVQVSGDRDTAFYVASWTLILLPTAVTALFLWLLGRP